LHPRIGLRDLDMFNAA